MKLFNAFIGILFAAFSLNAEVTVRAAMHVHSNISPNREESIQEIASKAKQRGMDAVFFSDHDFVDLEYGIPPFRVALSKNSVFKYGVDRYYSDIETAEKAFPGMLLFPGVETGAFYYWKRSGDGLLLEDWNKHMVVSGLSADELKKLPVLPNRSVRPFLPLKLWPLLLFIPGYILIRGIVFRKAGYLAVILAVLFLALNFPYTGPKYDNNGSAGIKPYQDLIDYVEGKGGLIFWAHPEAGRSKSSSELLSVGVDAAKFKVTTETKEYSGSLPFSKDFDGFAYFWEGEKTGAPGGLWDQMLLEYCEGKRAKPVYAFGELDYEKEGANGVFLDSVQNVIWAKDRTKAEVLKSLEEGRFYVLKKGNTAANLRIDLYNLSKDNTLNVSFSFAGRKSGRLKCETIVNGVPMSVLVEVPGGFLRKLDRKKTRQYVRVEITCLDDGSKIVTNPLFIEAAK